MRGLSGAIVLSLVVAVGCAQPAAKENVEVSGRSQAWQLALNSGDIDALVAMYADDAQLLPPNADMQQGKEAVAAAFGAMIDAGLVSELSTRSALSAGNLAHHVGTFTLTTRDGQMVDQGKFIETWRQIDGEWKITADIWNSNQPAARGQGMTVVVTHEVEDGDHWLAAWQGENSRAELFADHGIAGARTFRSLDDPNVTGLILDVTDMDAFQAYVTSEEGEAAKAEDGLREETMRMFLEAE